MTTEWTVVSEVGSAAELHGRSMPDPPDRRVEVMTVNRPVVVLGSTQPESIIDRDALAATGLDLARRRSGGGAVLLVPGESLWVDVVIPPTDSLWVDDVGRSFHWLGQAWKETLVEFGLTGEVHRGPLRSTEWSRLVCFGGLGPGEVTIGGSKIVGFSQRRSRSGARFQAIVHGRWQPDLLLGVLDLSAQDRDRASLALGPAAATVDVAGPELAKRLVAHLPR